MKPFYVTSEISTVARLVIFKPEHITNVTWLEFLKTVAHDLELHLDIVSATPERTTLRFQSTRQLQLFKRTVNEKIKKN